MNDDRLRQVEDLFEQLLSLDDAERETFLRRHAADDPEIVRELRSLLTHHSDEFLEDPAHVPDTVAADPEVIGPYRLTRMLGRGGMGVVYLAEQDRPVQRQVALKLIKLGMDTVQVVKRFERERQTLAMMNHPAIAHVYDAGSTEQGRPYFVMEYIEEGRPLTEYCDEQRLDVRGRLELFLEVCEGLQHAHQKGVIHQDIKPSNVLVTASTGRAIPKIIDFGIARATDSRQLEATVGAEMGQIIGTPEYMSPEQTDWNVRDIDTRTDVYSLGVLLYELLSGARPFDSRKLAAQSLEQLYRMVRDVDPPRLTTRLRGLPDVDEVASRRSTDASQLRRALAGDLEWITRKALAKNRDDRYATALDLAVDVRRFLVHEPVQARAPRTAYRVRKFVRRHRLAVAAASLVLFALLFGIVGTTVGMVRAVRSEAVSRAIESFMVGSFENADPSQSRGETITAREILDKSAERIREEFGEQPRVKGRLLLAMGQSYRGLGLYPRAEPLLRESLELLRGASGPGHPDVAIALNGLANVLVVDQRYVEALPLYEEALAIWQRTRNANDADLTTLLKHLGDVHAKLGNFDRSRSYLEQVLRIRRERLGPESLEFAKSLSSFGDMLARAGDPEAAIPFLEESLEIRRGVAESADGNVVGFGHWFLGDGLYRAGRFVEASEHLGAALDIWTEVFGGEHERVGACALRLAEALRGASDLEGADRRYRQALASDRASFGAEHPAVLEALDKYAGFLRETGRDQQAGELEAQARAIRRQSGEDF